MAMDESARRSSRYSESPPHHRHSHSKSVSRSPSRSKENGLKEDTTNIGNNLYVAGLSSRVSERDLKAHFSKEGKVLECKLVVDSRTKESRGFAFITMGSAEDADCCIKYLHRSTLEGRIITVERARRSRARTPTPGEYLGVQANLRPRARGYGNYGRVSYGSHHSPRYSPYSGRDRDWDRGRPSRYSPYRGGYRKDHSYSPRYSPFHR